MFKPLKSLLRMYLKQGFVVRVKKAPAGAVTFDRMVIAYSRGGKFLYQVVLYNRKDQRQIAVY